MRSSASTCSPIRRILRSGGLLLAFGCLLSTVASGETQTTELKLNWRFEPGGKLEYSVGQTTRIQHYRSPESGSTPEKSTIHVEKLTGVFSLNSLPDGNAAGDLVLALTEIDQGGQPVEVPPEQKIPQRVIRFILSPAGSMEEYIGSRKETYILTRMIFGLPIEGLKQNQVRIYPFQMFTGADNNRSEFTGNVSHELRSIDSTQGYQRACIVSTIDLKDVSGDAGLQDCIWKGMITSYFNLDVFHLEESTLEIAVKKVFHPEKKAVILQTVEIYTINIKLIRPSPSGSTES